jgi:hypothetical protein
MTRRQRKMYRQKVLLLRRSRRCAVKKAKAEADSVKKTVYGKKLQVRTNLRVLTRPIKLAFLANVRVLVMKEHELDICRRRRYGVRRVPLACRLRRRFPCRHLSRIFQPALFWKNNRKLGVRELNSLLLHAEEMGVVG